MTGTFTIKLNITDIPEFVTTANSITNDINLSQGQSVASGKSLMGVYSLNLCKPINLIVHDRKDDSIVFKKFGKWITIN